MQFVIKQTEGRWRVLASSKSASRKYAVKRNVWKGKDSDCESPAFSTGTPALYHTSQAPHNKISERCEKVVRQRLFWDEMMITSGPEVIC
jgi:hypothetical protein